MLIPTDKTSVSAMAQVRILSAGSFSSHHHTQQSSPVLLQYLMKHTVLQCVEGETQQRSINTALQHITFFKLYLCKDKKSELNCRPVNIKAATVLPLMNLL